ncbi:MAG: ammonium transporter [Bacteroidota bacterium]
MEAVFTVNNLWILVATVLVFVMHLGFAMLEAGFVQRKNVVNILFKNAMIISIGLLTYYLVGFQLMYPPDEGLIANIMGYFAPFDWSGGAISNYGEAAADGTAYTGYSDFIFQGMFAATCATIVSGAVAERIKLVPFLVFASIFVAIIYPIIGMWGWGGGWLADLDFKDFAGSSLVHAAGGFAALAAVLLLGPRRGKYRKDGGTTAMPGHSMPLAAMGVFLLWFGWFGFNGGSVLSADPNAVSLVFVTTSLAAAAGAIGAFIMSYALFKTYDLSMVLNGILGGLVGITASADVVTGNSAIAIGFIAGLIIPLSIVAFDKYLKIDDPVGATSVHGVCGIWGTIAVGIFGIGDFSLGTQIMGTLAIGGFAFIASFTIMGIIKAVVGIRVSETEEIKGLDVGEHDMHAYSLKEDGVFQLTAE